MMPGATHWKLFSDPDLRRSSSDRPLSFLPVFPSFLSFFLSFFGVSSSWHKSGQMKMSRSRFTSQRGFDCHVRVIDCSKDRGKSRNVITVLLRSVPPPGNQWEVKRDIDLRAAKSVAWDNWSGLGESGTGAQTCQRHLWITQSSLKIELPPIVAQSPAQGLCVRPLARASSAC